MSSLHYQLTKADLDEVIVAAQTSADNNSPAMNEILRRFTPLAHRVAWSQTKCPHFQGDLVVECLRVAVGAVRRHQIGTPGFPSFIESFMRGAASRMAKHERNFLAGPHDLPFLSLNDSNLIDRTAVNSVALDDKIGDRVDPWGGDHTTRFVDTLSNGQKQLLSKVHVDGYTVKELAEENGVSSSAISQRISTIHQSARRYLAALSPQQ